MVSSVIFLLAIYIPRDLCSSYRFVLFCMRVIRLEFLIGLWCLPIYLIYHSATIYVMVKQTFQRYGTYRPGRLNVTKVMMNLNNY